jgi:hypothetical protein
MLFFCVMLAAQKKTIFFCAMLAQQLKKTIVYTLTLPSSTLKLQLSPLSWRHSGVNSILFLPRLRRVLLPNLSTLGTNNLLPSLYLFASQ